MDGEGGAVRGLGEASVRVACREVREGRGAAVVSAGHTGATVLAAVLELGTLPGCARPALVASLPRVDAPDLLLVDAGASVEAKAELLVTFATIGAAWAAVLGRAGASIGLLSNGAEPTKGTHAVREAAAALGDWPEFVGQVEPHDALRGRVDVLVCDGFSGNLVLKAAEGAVGLWGDALRDAVQGDVRAAAGVALLRPALERVRQRFDLSARGGALLAGVRAPVVVAHGRSDAAAVRAAIHLAHYACVHGLTDSLASRLAPVPAALAPGHGADAAAASRPRDPASPHGPTSESR